MENLKEIVEDNTERLNALEKEINFLLTEIKKIKSEIKKGGKS